jgi:hypothetical protein
VWRVALKRDLSGMVKFKRVSYFSVEKVAFFQSFGVCKGRFHDLLKKKPFSLFIRMEFSLCHFPDDAFHAS